MKEKLKNSAIKKFDDQKKLTIKKKKKKTAARSVHMHYDPLYCKILMHPDARRSRAPPPTVKPRGSQSMTTPGEHKSILHIYIICLLTVLIYLFPARLPRIHQNGRGCGSDVRWGVTPCEMADGKYPRRRHTALWPRGSRTKRKKKKEKNQSIRTPAVEGRGIGHR